MRARLGRKMHVQDRMHMADAPGGCTWRMHMARIPRQWIRSSNGDGAVESRQ